jgi:hypothetical protein
MKINEQDFRVFASENIESLVEERLQSGKNQAPPVAHWRPV